MFELLAQIVEKQPAHATRLVAMAQEKVFVAPTLVRCIALFAEWLAQRLCNAVPVLHILIEGIERSQVEAAAKPGGHHLAIALGAEVAHVHVRGRDVRIVRMKHQRDAACTPGCTGKLGAVRTGRRRQARAGHIGKADAGLLEHGAVAQDAGTATAALLALPKILGEPRLPVGSFHSGADPVLQVGQIIAYTVEFVHGPILSRVLHVVYPCQRACLSQCDAEDG